MGKRELLLHVLNNQKAERVPVGFWFHFLEDKKNHTTEQIRKNIEGHQRFYEEFHPDFLKLMSDGFFGYPSEAVQSLKNGKDLDQVKAASPETWIEEQVALVKELTGRFGKEVLIFYNIFAPVSYLKFQLMDKKLTTVGRLLDENPEGLARALGEIAKDISELARRVITEGRADGIYLSVQNIQEDGISKEDYRKYISPSELAVLESANKLTPYNLLHICGFAGAKNDLTIYTDYPAKAVNWAVTAEHVSLKEGKKLFGGKAVIGGFANTENDLLYKGTKEEIEAETEALLAEAGDTGVILGADCTVPGDINLERLEWVRQKAKALSENVK